MKDRPNDDKGQSNYIKECFTAAFQKMTKWCSSITFAALPQDDENTAAIRWLQALYQNATGKKSTMSDFANMKIKRYGNSCSKAAWSFNGVET
jgi:hypothetical protein